MDLSGPTATANASATALLNAPPTPEPEADSVLSSDFQTFLLMLTEQMKNQDPLNPTQSTDFSVQLATFSGVEQQVKTNELIESLSQALTLGELGQIAGWVGKEGRAAVPAVYDGRPIDVFPAVPADADQATLVIRDASAREVSRVAFDPASQRLAWDGTDFNGAHVAAGTYSFFVEARAAGDLLSVEPAAVYARITEVRTENGAAQAVFADGSARNLTEISGIREAGST